MIAARGPDAALDRPFCRQLAARGASIVRVETPTSLDDLADALRASRGPFLPVGSGLEGAIDFTGSAVVIDTRALTEDAKVDVVSQTLEISAGATWREAEAVATASGLTLGFISDVAVDATIGGSLSRAQILPALWPAHTARAATLSLVAVSPSGSVYSAVAAPRTSSGPDLRGVFVGTMGRAGVIARVVLQCERADTCVWLGRRAADVSWSGLQQVVNHFGTIVTARGVGREFRVRVRTGSGVAGHALEALAALGFDDMPPVETEARPRAIAVLPWDDAERAVTAESAPAGSMSIRILACGPTHVAVAAEPVGARGNSDAERWARKCVADSKLGRVVVVGFAPDRGGAAEPGRDTDD